MAKILLIDDDKLLTKMYSDTFKEDGHEVQVASDGLDGLKKAVEFKPDLILLDIIMPKLNGLDTLKKLKERDETRKIPVVMLTIVGFEQGVEKGLNLGAATYMIKASYSSKEVKEKIDEILEGTVRRKPHEIPEVKTQIKKEPFTSDSD